MMQEDVLLPHDLENVRMRRERRVACRLEDAVLPLGESVVRHQRHQVAHAQRAIEPVKIGFGQLEKAEQLLAHFARAIRFHFQAHGIAAARASQFLLDRAEEVLRFFLIDIEVAVSGHAKGVHVVEQQAREKVADEMFNQRREVDVVPRLVAGFAARHLDQARDHPRHLHDREERRAPFLRAGADEQVVALVEQLRERMARVDRQRREHRKDFLLEVTPRPGGAFRV